MSAPTIDRTIPDPAQEPTITAGRLAAILGVSVRSVYSGVERGEIPTVRVGRRVLILTERALTALGLLPGA